METRYVTSADGARIAYTITGKGPVLLLVHGGMSTKKVWEETGWIEALQEKYTIIMPDIRGNGESDVSEDMNFYHINNILNDIEAVLEACKVEKFYYLGHSYGATIGFHVFKNNRKVIKAVCAGSAPGEHFSKVFAPEIRAFYEEPNRHKKANTLDQMDISEEDREWVRNTNLDLLIAQMSSWETWPVIQCEELNSKLAVYSGTNDHRDLLDNLKSLEDKLTDNNVRYKIFDDLNHGELISKPEVVLPWIREFFEQ